MTYSKTDEYIRTIIFFDQRRACPLRFSLLKTTTIHKKFSTTRRETTIQGVEAQGAVEHGEVHRDLRELHRRVLFGLHDLTLLVHNHLSTWAGVLQSFTVTYFILLQGALNQHMQVSKGESRHACMRCN